MIDRELMKILYLEDNLKVSNIGKILGYTDYYVIKALKEFKVYKDGKNN